MASFTLQRFALALGGALAAAGPAAAVSSNAVIGRHALSARAAEIVARAALEACTAKGYHVAVAVSDADGELVVLLRGDGGGVHLLDAARRKAFTSASSGARTSAWEKAIDERSGVPDPHIVDVKDVLAVGGGVPIFFGKEVVGAVGVSGSPGVAYDEQCADIGVRAIDDLDSHVGP
jgi:uncharacterized protein GlcG (DUF336 family)